MVYLSVTGDDLWLWRVAAEICEAVRHCPKLDLMSTAASQDMLPAASQLFMAFK
jgi:hypothetical protein